MEEWFIDDSNRTQVGAGLAVANRNWQSPAYKHRSFSPAHPMPDGPHIIHVIEKSAADKLAEALDQAVEALKNSSSSSMAVIKQGVVALTNGQTVLKEYRGKNAVPKT